MLYDSFMRLRADAYICADASCRRLSIGDRRHVTAPRARFAARVYSSERPDFRSSPLLM